MRLRAVRHKSLVARRESYMVSDHASYSTLHVSRKGNRPFHKIIQEQLFHFEFTTYILHKNLCPQGLPLVIAEKIMLAFRGRYGGHRIVFEVETDDLPRAVVEQGPHPVEVVPKFKVEHPLLFPEIREVPFPPKPMHGFGIHTRKEKPRVFRVNLEEIPLDDKPLALAHRRNVFHVAPEKRLQVFREIRSGRIFNKQLRIKFYLVEIVEEKRKIAHELARHILLDGIQEYHAEFLEVAYVVVFLGDEFFRHRAPLGAQHLYLDIPLLEIVLREAAVRFLERLMHPFVRLKKPKRAEYLRYVVMREEFVRALVFEERKEVVRHALPQNILAVRFFEEKSPAGFRNGTRKMRRLVELRRARNTFEVRKELDLVLPRRLAERRAHFLGLHIHGETQAPQYALDGRFVVGTHFIEHTTPPHEPDHRNIELLQEFL